MKLGNIVLQPFFTPSLKFEACGFLCTIKQEGGLAAGGNSRLLADLKIAETPWVVMG